MEVANRRKLQHGYDGTSATPACINGGQEQRSSVLGSSVDKGTDTLQGAPGPLSGKGRWMGNTAKIQPEEGKTFWEMTIVKTRSFALF